MISRNNKAQRTKDKRRRTNEPSDNPSLDAPSESMDYQPYILNKLVDAIAAGDLDVDQDASSHFHSCADRVNAGDQSAWTAFTDYLTSNQSVARTEGTFLVGTGYGFLDDELDRLRDLKERGELTEADRAFALGSLTGLIDQVTKLACKVGTPESKR